MIEFVKTSTLCIEESQHNNFESHLSIHRNANDIMNEKLDVNIVKSIILSLYKLIHFEIKGKTTGIQSTIRPNSNLRNYHQVDICE